MCPSSTSMYRSSTSSRHPNATSATTTDDEEHDCNRGLWDPRHDPQREALMAWFRRMGLDEVAYHQATVVGRGDDHAGQALDYYGSRGETPLRWGGAGAARLGLAGEVTPAGHEAAFGPGGFPAPLRPEERRGGTGGGSKDR